MDPITIAALKNVMLGVAGNGLTSLLVASGRAAKSYILDEESLNKMREKERSLHGILQNAADGLAETIQWHGPGELDQVCSFLMSPEVDSIMRQVYSAKYLNKLSTL